MFPLYPLWKLPLMQHCYESRLIPGRVDHWVESAQISPSPDTLEGTFGHELNHLDLDSAMLPSLRDLTLGPWEINLTRAHAQQSSEFVLLVPQVDSTRAWNM